ncbi:glutamyl/glutaminyl-tRNA synthetase [Actinorugispora endophytica]|uniref:Glutamyl/glutaminyl-tRNA synthetase n=1 Tax=Actinorugispora endophytica TaxID=1605990 RepID=A0A4V3D944_9ACTN|nr:glutamyl/glutaminyl-tRNA synthetase [Actinorugispora endophytica]
MTNRAWYTHPTVAATASGEIRTRLGIAPNHASFRVGVLRTHLLTSLLAYTAAEFLGTSALVRIRWDDTDAARSDDAHRARLLGEVQRVAQIPVHSGEQDLRQSLRGSRYNEALRTLAKQGVLASRRGVPCLDIAAVDRLMAEHGRTPEELAASVMVNARKAHAPTQDFVPLTRADGRALWHLATVVDDIDQRTTLIVRGRDKINATTVQVRLHWALTSGGAPPAHVFLPRLLDEHGSASRIVHLLDSGIRPAAIRWFLAEPYLGTVPATLPETFADLVSQACHVLPKHGDSRFDERRLASLDRKISAVLSPAVCACELRDNGASGPAHTIEWVATHYRRPLPQQLRLCQALTRPQIDHEPPPEQAEEALRWLDAWTGGTTQDTPPQAVRWVLTGRTDGPGIDELLAVLPGALVPGRIAAARQAVSLANAERSRRTVRSRPSSSSDSNSGSPTVRPVTATRTGA